MSNPFNALEGVFNGPAGLAAATIRAQMTQSELRLDQLSSLVSSDFIIGNVAGLHIGIA